MNALMEILLMEMDVTIYVLKKKIISVGFSDQNTINFIVVKIGFDPTAANSGLITVDYKISLKR